MNTTQIHLDKSNLQKIEELDNLNIYEKWLLNKVVNNNKGIFKSPFIIKLLTTISVERSKNKTC